MFKTLAQPCPFLPFFDHEEGKPADALLKCMLKNVSQESWHGDYKGRV